MPTPPATRPDSPVALAGLRAGLITALTYAVLGGLGLALTGSPHTAAAYPLAGVALAAALVWGRAALPGVWLGAALVFGALAWLRGDAGAVLSPVLLGAGAALQAGVGAALVRRFVAQPLVLNAPRDILRFVVFGGLLASLVGACAAVAVLSSSGAIAAGTGLATWLNWWVGNGLGVPAGAALVLPLIGQPRVDWRHRRRTVALPMLVALVLLALILGELGRVDAERQQTDFDRDADQLASEARARLAAPLNALQALDGAARARGGVDERTLLQASRWWLAQPLQIQATGYSERVPVDALPAFEARVRAEGGPADYTVFDRDHGGTRAVDGEVVAVRYIDPLVGNAGALGVNALSVPTARAAILATRDSGMPTATAGFALTQSRTEDTGVVLYQALYRDEPADQAARRARFLGVVFVTVRLDRALAGMHSAAGPALRWCLVDTDPRAERRRLAGPVGCEAPAGSGALLVGTRPLRLADRQLELRIAADAGALRSNPSEVAWLRRLAGLAAAAMLAALLLTVTGSRRRTQLAVRGGTAELRRQMAERARAQTALAESEARLRSILDHVPLGVMFLDPEGRLLECNPRLCEMVGRSAATLRQTAVSELIPPEEMPRIVALRRALLAGAADITLDRLRLREHAGREMLVRVTASALRNGSGRVMRMVGVLEDITEHLQLEASERALHQAEAASRAKSEFVSRMSHELRTPLNAMIGFAQLLGLDREPTLVAHQRDWVQQIQRAGWHLLEMINETLDLARIESGAVQLTLEPVALAPLVAACRSMLSNAAQQRDIALVDELDDDAFAVVADATRLKQVLTNLMSNAIKYNRDGGSVTVMAHRVPEASGGTGDSIEIAVADTGLGMTPAQLEGLFQPYNRLGREGSGIEGTGIGLVISRRLSELMGGTLQAASEAGRGSVFTLRLPAAAAATAPALRYTNTSPAPYQQRLVHYVEDNETNIEVMRGIFAQRPQIRLQTSTLGLDGLSAIRASRPDLVLLDMQLPDISGIEMLRYLKQDDALAGIPVVIVSADATPGHMQEALVAGALHYATKPLDVGRFLHTVDEILEEIDTRWGF